jgi:DNA-binding CsgD family transcriptional regulator
VNSDLSERFLELIERVYDAVGDNQLWLGIAKHIASVFDSTSVVLKMHSVDGNVQLLETTDNLVISPKDSEWAEYWHHNDLWVERSLSSGLSKVVTSQQLVQVAEFERSGFYQDWNRKLGIYHMVGSVFPVATNTNGVLGIHRDKRAGVYEECDRHSLAQFLPHLQRALRMHHRLAGAIPNQAIELNALNRIGIGALVVDIHCRVLYANSACENILRHGKSISISGGHLGSSDPAITNQLARLVRQSIQTASGKPSTPAGSFILLQQGQLPISVSVEPLRPTWGSFAATQPAAMVFICDPETQTPDQKTLRELFGLTRTEATIAAALATGKSPDEIAVAFGIGIGTARSHLKKILAKTGTRRQAQLVALILRSVAGLEQPKNPEKS